MSRLDTSKARPAPGATWCDLGLHGVCRSPNVTRCGCDCHAPPTGDDDE